MGFMNGLKGSGQNKLTMKKNKPLILLVLRYNEYGVEFNRMVFDLNRSGN